MTHDIRLIFRVNRIFDMMDADGSGDLSKAEFLEGAHKDSLILGKGLIASI